MSSQPRGRDQILRAAVEAFAERGFDGTSTAAVARAAGVTQPLVHHHFGSKRGLYDAVLDALFGPMLDRVREAMAEVEAGPPEAGLRHLLASLTLAMAAEPALARLLVVEGGREGEASTALWARWGGPVDEIIGPIAEHAVATKQAPDVPRWMLISLVLGAVSRPFLEVGVIRLRDGSDPLQPEAIRTYAALVADVLATGLAARARAEG